MLFRSMSQARKTRQTPGVPDLIVFNSRAGRMWFFECKAEGARPSPAQVYFAELCETAGIDYVIGGTFAAINHLRQIGVARE